MNDEYWDNSWISENGSLFKASIEFRLTYNDRLVMLFVKWCEIYKIG